VSDGSIDQGVALAVVTGLLALVYLALAVWNFRNGRNGVGAARLFAAVLFGAVAGYIVVFEMRVF
jgi:multisubunit Na+/H+ antiporter MnhB subunit